MYNATDSTITKLNARSIHAGAAAPQADAENIILFGAQQNELLRALSREDLLELSQHLELVTLPVGKYLFECGQTMDYAYFPTNAIVSLQYVMEDGATTEIGVVGREGVAGVSMYAAERANCNAVVQSAGYGYRVPAAVLRLAFCQGGALAFLLMRHASTLLAQLAQTVASTRHSNVEQKVCRWLLDRLDRSNTNELKVTQETIGNLLGVRRESITAAAGKLNAEGLIDYRRGKVTVLDRPALEQRAGSCYLAGRAVANDAHLRSAA
ncbi:Crp/Fnr family transcriptional regulator [Oxalobacteraceae bacterium]|nr:Crp/Fnr family transcriptional regulator [Oxalobacteraceae bacterium]